MNKFKNQQIFKRITTSLVLSSLLIAYFYLVTTTNLHIFKNIVISALVLTLTFVALNEILNVLWLKYKIYQSLKVLFFMLTSSIVLCFWVYHYQWLALQNFIYLLIGLLLITLLVSLITIWIFYFYIDKKQQQYNFFKLILFVWFSMLLIGLFGLNLLFLTIKKPIWLLFMTVCCILTDIFAFICGISFGKTKIFKCSPNKSLEGFVCGIFVSTLLTWCLMLGFLYLKTQTDWDIKWTWTSWQIYVIFPVMAFIIALLSQVSDLSFSYFKRKNDIKDFSNFLPGHGGILDRIDSWFMPIFCTTLFLLSYSF